MDQFQAYIGRQTRVVSKQNVRYSGTMQFIDPVAQKIRVTNVRCFGTEDRPADVFMPPLEHPFNLVEFNVGDLNDLKFEDAVPAPTSTPPAAPSGGHASAPTQAATTTHQQPQSRPPQPTHVTSFSAEKAKPPGVGYNSASPMPTQQQQQSQYNAPTATGHPTSTDTLQRAMDSMTLNNGPAPRSNGVSPAPPHSGGGNHSRGGGGQGRRGRGGRTNGNYQNQRDHHRQPHHLDAKIPSTDFDFEGMNQKFDKGAAAKQHSLLAGGSSGTDANATADPGNEPAPLAKAPTPVSAVTPVEVGEAKAKADVGEKIVYNPSKSFFDNISSDANSKKPSRGGGPPGERAPRNTQAGEGGHVHRGRGRGGHGRSRRDEEREKNFATFGEAGGVGLLGPGAYVGGYGGYRGRRRRGGPGGGGGGGGGGRGARGGGGAPRVAAA